MENEFLEIRTKKDMTVFVSNLTKIYSIANEGRVVDEREDVLLRISDSLPNSAYFYKKGYFKGFFEIYYSLRFTFKLEREARYIILRESFISALKVFIKENPDLIKEIVFGAYPIEANSDIYELTFNGKGQFLDSEVRDAIMSDEYKSTETQEYPIYHLPISQYVKKDIDKTRLILDDILPIPQHLYVLLSADSKFVHFSNNTTDRVTGDEVIEVKHDIFFNKFAEGFFLMRLFKDNKCDGYTTINLDTAEQNQD